MAGSPHREEWRFSIVNAESLPALRRWLRQQLDFIGPEVLIDVELVCTELATNALEHANGPRDLRLILFPERGVLRVEMVDTSPDRLPTPGRSRAGPHRGRGLNLVTTLADWGLNLHTSTKTLWAEIRTAQLNPGHSC